jgi:3-oxoacyl-[acyl-carrier-protein] synthase-1
MKPSAGRPTCNVIAHSVRCALGLNSLQTIMAIRAGQRARWPSHLRDSEQSSVLASSASLPATLVGFERFAALGACALRGLGRELVAPTVPLLLTLPEKARPDIDERWGTPLVEQIAKLANVSLDMERSAVFCGGHAALAVALWRALELLHAGDDAPRWVLLGGVDSYLHPDVVRWLEEQGRLAGPKPTGGIVPGEAAAMLALTRVGGRPLGSRAAERTLPGAAELEPRATICALEAALVEDAPAAASPATTGEKPELDGEPPTAARVTAAMLTRLIEACPSVPVEWTLTDVNGEERRIREWTAAWMAQGRPGARHDRVAEHLGELGAATGPVCIALAAAEWQARCAPAPSALVALHSDGPPRAAVMLQAPSESSYPAERPV